MIRGTVIDTNEERLRTLAELRNVLGRTVDGSRGSIRRATAIRRPRHTMIQLLAPEAWREDRGATFSGNEGQLGPRAAAQLAEIGNDLKWVRPFVQHPSEVGSIKRTPSIGLY